MFHLNREEKLAAFDPNGVGAAQAQIFGLPFNYVESRVILLPVPWDATASYRPGSAAGPRIIREASPQLDLFDPDYPDSWKEGFFLLDISEEWARRNRLIRPSVSEYLRLLENGARPAIADNEGLTPLMRAAWNGHQDVVRVLIDAGTPLAETDGVGKSALDYAIEGGHRDIARVLRALGA